MLAPATIEKSDRSLPPDIENVRAVAAECPAAQGISLAVLHGSRARGNAAAAAAAELPRD